MSSVFDPLRALCLAGTVTIPSPFPQLGRITLATIEHATLAPTPGCNVKSARPNCLRIEHVQSPRLLIARYVLLEEVEAVFLPADPDAPHLLEGKWYAGTARCAKFAKRLARRADGDAAVGIVYVREQARVLMHVEVGMTAAESAEYYPPMVRDRSDAHYSLTDDAEIRAQALPRQWHCCD